MAKRSGSTRSSSSGSPTGISRMENQNGFEMVNRTALALESLAERLRQERRLNVDADDAVYEQARNLGVNNIEFSIEMSTDYVAQVSNGNIIIQSQYTPEDEAIRNYGTERVSIPMENRSLIDIISELRTSSESSIFNKYR